MLLTFKNISPKYSFGLLINGYFLSMDKYLECAKKFDGDNKIFVDTSSILDQIMHSAITKNIVLNVD